MASNEMNNKAIIPKKFRVNDYSGSGFRLPREMMESMLAMDGFTAVKIEEN